LQVVITNLLSQAQDSSLTLLDDMRSFITGLVGIIGLAIAQSSAASLPPTAHPADGKVPPQNAIVVSKSGDGKTSFSKISDALASLPNDNTEKTIFVYAGEHLYLATGAGSR
jgi:pectin methylesterase-like acyl-CoA thioesterase